MEIPKEKWYLYILQQCGKEGWDTFTYSSSVAKKAGSDGEIASNSK